MRATNPEYADIGVETEKYTMSGNTRRVYLQCDVPWLPTFIEEVCITKEQNLDYLLRDLDTRFPILKTIEIIEHLDSYTDTYHMMATHPTLRSISLTTDGDKIENLIIGVAASKSITSLRLTGSLRRSRPLPYIGMLTNLRILAVRPSDPCYIRSLEWKALGFAIIELAERGNLYVLVLGRISASVLLRALKMRSNLEKFAIDGCFEGMDLTPYLGAFFANNPLERFSYNFCEPEILPIYNVVKYRRLKKISSWQIESLPSGDTNVIVQ